MPIKPENKKLYPKNWDEISKHIRFGRANNHCEVCNIQNHNIIKRLRYDKFRNATESELSLIYTRAAQTSLSESLKHHGFIRIVLTVGHLDHDPTNNDDSNLKAMCQKCHNNYDQKHRKSTRHKEKCKGMKSLFD